MDLIKNVYLNNKTYIAKLSTTSFGNYDLALFTKYYEPTIDIGGTITDGTTTFSLTSVQQQIMSQSPIVQYFDSVSIGSYEEAGARANIYVNVIGERIRTVMNDLRNLDSTTNSELNKIMVI